MADKPPPPPLFKGVKVIKPFPVPKLSSRERKVDREPREVFRVKPDNRDSPVVLEEVSPKTKPSGELVVLFGTKTGTEKYDSGDPEVQKVTPPG